MTSHLLARKFAALARQMQQQMAHEAQLPLQGMEGIQTWRQIFEATPLHQPSRQPTLQASCWYKCLPNCMGFLWHQRSSCCRPLSLKLSRICTACNLGLGMQKLHCWWAILACAMLGDPTQLFILPLQNRSAQMQTEVHTHMHSNLKATPP